MSLSPDTITQQLTLLATHRRSLAALLQQLALLGGVDHASLGVLNSIEDARTNIARIKATLREGGVQLEDAPNDEAPPQSEPVQQARGDVVYGDKVAGDKVMGNTRTVDTGGGDYAEGNIEKRQGMFVSGGSVQGPVIGVAGTVTTTIYQHALPQTLLTAQERRNRGRILQKVRDFWVKGVLEKSLYNETLIALGLEQRPDAVAHPWDMLIQQLDSAPQPLPPAVRIVEVFDDVGGELLILGAPGSGKTTLLLELARNLLARAEIDETYSIPVIFNLSSWATRRRVLADWLVDELNERYDVPRKVGQEWIDTDALLLLLDGLDEVKLEFRETCVEVINSFRRHHGLVNLVVCSRMSDYETLSVQLRLQGAVLVRPLTQQQIDDYLASAGDQLAGLRGVLAEDSTLYEMARSPLMLSVMALAYQGVSITALRTSGPLEERRKRLFAAYVKRMSERRGADTRYSYEQMSHWLAMLAREMQRKAQSVFLIERLQPDWLVTRRQICQYNSIDRLGGAVVIGLFCGLSGALSGGPFLGLLLGTGGALLLGLFGGTGRTRSDSRRSFGLSVRNALFGGLTSGLIGLLIISPIFGLRAGLGSGLLLGLSGTLAGGLAGRPDLQPRQIVVIEVLRWSPARAVHSVLGGLIFGIGGGLGIALIFGLAYGRIGTLSVALAVIMVGGLVGALGGIVGGLIANEIEIKVAPNQGIWRSGRNGLLGGLIGAGIGALGGGLAAGLIGALVFGINSSLLLGMVGGLLLGLASAMIGALAYGGYACLSHLALRCVLWRSRVMPWNIAHFLDYCTDRIFLRRVGGGWIFVHRLLLDYFASLYTEHPPAEPAEAQRTNTLSSAPPPAYDAVEAADSIE